MESVRGVVFGPVTHRYRLVNANGEAQGIGGRSFATDAEAVRYYRERFPECFDAKSPIAKRYGPYEVQRLDA